MAQPQLLFRYQNVLFSIDPETKWVSCQEPREPFWDKFAEMELAQLILERAGYQGELELPEFDPQEILTQLAEEEWITL